MAGAHGENDRRNRRHKKERPLAEHDREKARLADEKRESEHAVGDSATGEEFAEQRAQCDRGADER